MNRTAARVAVACALAGLLASIAAAYVHYNILRDPSYLSFCDVSETMNCSQVYSSRYGSFMGVSVAVFGAIWFAVALLLSTAGLIARPEIRESVPGYLFAGSTLALAVVLYLGYASFAVLGLVCILCLITYAAVIGLFLVSGAAASAPMLSLPRRAAHDLKVLAASPLAIGVTAVLLAGAAAALIWFPRDSPASLMAAPQSGTAPAAAADDERAQFERWYATQPRLPLDIPLEGAKVLVVKFNDYQCPPCRQTHMEYKSVFEKWQASNPGAVRYVLRDFPLDNECNAAVTTDFHAAACEAAVAVRLAREKDRASELEEWIFANQPALTPALVRQAARDIAKITDMDARYAATLELVKADIALGRKLGVQSTPTFFINGTRVEGGLPTVYFDQAIAYELQKASSQ
jgi:uncharacterized membrane protein/protein-disulfide isomerase